MLKSPSSTGGLARIHSLQLARRLPYFFAASDLGMQLSLLGSKSRPVRELISPWGLQRRSPCSLDLKRKGSSVRL